MSKIKKPVIKKSISFREDVYGIAEEMADTYFGGNFSAYLTYLVCADKHGLSRAKDSDDDRTAKEEIKEGIGNFVRSDENDDYINQFIDM